MASNSEWFLQQSQLAFERKRDLYNQLLQGILSQSLKTPGQRKAELDLLAREETTLRTLEDSLRKSQREQIKSDSSLLEALSKGQTDIATANISFNEGVRTATIKSQTDLQIEKSRAERQIDEDAAVARSKASELASAALTDAGNFGPGVFSASDPVNIVNTGVGYLKNLWSTSFESKAKAATTPEAKQAVVDAYKRASGEWLAKQQPGTPINAVLSDPEVQAQATATALRDMRVPDLGQSADALIDAQAASKKASLDVPTSVGGGGTRGVDEQILLTRKERAQALLGLDAATLGPAALKVDLKDNEVTPYEGYLASAAYNRMQLADPAQADAFYAKYPTLNSWNEAIKAGTIDADASTLIQDTELLDTTSLKMLHDGEYPRGFAELRSRRGELDAQKKKLMEGGDEAQTIENAVQQARYLYRKLYGDAPTQTGISAAETLRKELGGKTPEEVQAVLSQLPLNDRGMQVALKAVSGAPITDKELRTLDLGQSNPATLPASVIEKFNTRLPGFIAEDGTVVVGYDDKGTPTKRDVDELTLTDFGEALASYQGDADGNGTVDPDTAAKIKESMRLLQELTQAQPYLTPYLTHVAATQLDKVLGPSPDAQPARKPQTRITGPKLDEILLEDAPQPQGFNEASIKRQEAITKVSPDVLSTSAIAVQEKTGRAPTSKEMVAGIDSQLAGFSKEERRQISDLARQSKGIDSKIVQANLQKIVSPITDPDKYTQAVSYIGVASTPQVADLYAEERKKKIKRDLDLLA